MRQLTDARVRLGLGTVTVLVTALSARRDRVGHGEAQAFRALNGLPDSLYGPVWVIMQLGALGGKLCGGGGGGFLLMIVPPDRRSGFCDALQVRRCIDFEIDFLGSTLTGGRG